MRHPAAAVPVVGATLPSDVSEVVPAVPSRSACVSVPAAVAELTPYAMTRNTVPTCNEPAGKRSCVTTCSDVDNASVADLDACAPRISPGPRLSQMFLYVTVVDESTSAVVLPVRSLFVMTRLV